MNTKRITIIIVTVTLFTLLASGNPALATWDVQEKCFNNTGQDAYDLTKIVVMPEGGAVTSAISNQLGDPNITTYPPTVKPGSVSFIHWEVKYPPDVPVPGTPVPPDGWVWACFNVSGQPKPANAFWTDQNGNIIGMAAVEVTASGERDEQGNVWVRVGHSWIEWTGRRWPPSTGDALGAPLGPITGTDVYYAITNVRRSLEELNEARYDDPDIKWERLADFRLTSGGDPASYNLGRLSNRDFVLLRFVATAERIRTETIHQFQPPSEIPTVSQWGLIIMAVLLVSAGAIVIRRRQRIAA